MGNLSPYAAKCDHSPRMPNIFVHVRCLENRNSSAVVRKHEEKNRPPVSVQFQQIRINRTIFDNGNSVVLHRIKYT